MSRLVLLAAAGLVLHGAHAAAARAGGGATAHVVLHAALVVVMVGCFRVAGGAGPAARTVVLGAAVAFRAVALLEPAWLSDDVHRYVWDGRVQVHGVSPYALAPADPRLAALRDEGWARINHPELPTIYPAAAELWFAALAGLGAGVTGFRVAAAVLDLGVVLALLDLLRRAGLPWTRVVLYAWNPLAVIEAAGSGHVEPLGVMWLVLGAAWILAGHPGLSTSALSLAVAAKLFPAVLVPGWIRRVPGRAVAAGAAVLAALCLPYAATGPAWGGGAHDYAARWEGNGLVFPALRGCLAWLEPTPALEAGLAVLQERLPADALPWDWLYRHLWPDDLARGAVALAAAAWVVRLAFRPGLSVPREAMLALGGVLLLSPTVHPWYLLWVLPFAAALASPAWLAWATLVPLAYLGGPDGPGWGVRALEYVPVLVLLLHERFPGFATIRRWTSPPTC